MFKLYPNEELIIEAETNPRLDEHKKSRYLLVVALILFLTALFYDYARTQDFVLSAVFWVAIMAMVASLAAYGYKMYAAGKEKGSIKYYLTSTRIVAADKTGKVIREMLLARVKRVEIDKITGKAGDVIINPKNLSPQEEYKLKLRGDNEKKYAKETFVIKSIADAQTFAKALTK